MALNPQAGSSFHSRAFHPPSVSRNPSGGGRHPPPHGQFDILEWYPQFQSCYRYFIDHAQHSAPVQALAAFINIQLPYQRQPHPITSTSTPSPHPLGPLPELPPHLRHPSSPAHAVSLIPYIRRLIVTGHDSPGILHGFFGDDWAQGIGSLHEVERRNYLFAAKSTSWMDVKQTYDMSPEETVPCLCPLKDATEEEIVAAEATWSEWLAMQDWMLGPRAPEAMAASPRIKREV